ncbi:MAG TPA: T9SS type A sorting domain-containing protein [Bacteroidales bacterium]|nr:T9SS type A sorting domain-containing protein [Bacteroidales bacterium]
MQFKKVLFIFILLSWLTGIYAQKAILSTGGRISSMTGSVCYSVGQMIYNTRKNVNAARTIKKVGFSVMSETNKVNNITSSCSIYPNPTSNYFCLKIENFEKDNFTYQLFDMYGKLIKFQKVENYETKIDILNLLPAMYFLKVKQKNLDINSYKIIKE